MRQILLVLFMVLFVHIGLACSSKEQLNVLFTSVRGENLLHKNYATLGETLFSTGSLASVLHAYNITINHKVGEMVFDVESENTSIQSILKEIKPLLKANGFKILRVSFETPITGNDI